METDMTKGSIPRHFLVFSLPLFLGNMFQMLYSFADTIIVGRFVGVSALAAVGSTGGFVFLLLGFAEGLAAGFAVPISHSYGARDGKTLKKAYAMGIVSSFLISLVVCVLFYPLSMKLLVITQTPVDIIQQAYEYISIIFLGVGAAVYYNYFSAVLRAVGDGRSPVLFLVLTSVANVVLDLIFVLVFSLGCFGVALATVISQAVSAILSFFYIWVRYPRFRLSRSSFSPDWNLLKRLHRIGIPGALQLSVCAIGCIILQIAINRFGSDYVASFSIAVKIENFTCQIYPAIGMAMSTFAGQNLGAGNFKRIRQGFSTGALISVVISVITSVLIWFCSPALVSLFVDSGSAASLVIDNAVLYSRTIVFFFIPLSFIYLYRSGCQGLGSGMIPMYSSTMELVLRVMAGFLLPPFIGYFGICLSSPLAWSAAGLTLPFIYHWYINKKEAEASS